MASKIAQAASLNLRLICLAPPAANPEDGDEIFGLQDKHGRIDPGVTQADGSVVYEFVVQALLPAGGEALRFRGPQVHGPADDPFVYLSLRDPHSGAWVRRLKVRLGSITPQQLEAASAQGYLYARVEGYGSASVPLLDDGWTTNTHE